MTESERTPRPRRTPRGATAPIAPPAERDVDVAVFGASGFVGKLVAEYLAEHVSDGVRIALAGRSQERLARVRDELGSRAAAWPLLVADSSDAASLQALARAARVVVTTVGPYRPRGLNLVGACVEAGTDYADLTGEVLFMRDSIDRYHDAAARQGTRIVHACGFDSIPSDLGVLLLHDTAADEDGGELERTSLVVTALRGGLSGGTFESMRGTVDEAKRSVRARRLLGDPYALSPDRAREPRLGDESDLRGVERDSDTGMWVGPFVMAPANTRVVRRSNALQDWAYGRRFRYREVMGFGSGISAPVKAGAFSAGLTAFAAGLAFTPSRALLDRVLPKPGEGPSEATRRTGLFRLEVHGRTSEGSRYVANVSAHGDPGYAATAVMLGETGLCLALDRDRLPGGGGVLTPATALGAPLMERLRAAGHTYTASRVEDRARASL